MQFAHWTRSGATTLALVLLLPSLAVAAAPPTFLRGMTIAFWTDAAFDPVRLEPELSRLEALGVDSVAVVVTATMDGPRASSILPDTVPSTPVLRRVLERLHARGFRVLLKPHVDVRTGEFRGAIHPTRWDEWHFSYADYLLRMADLAREGRCEGLSIGTELASATWSATPWRRLITRVRRRFSGMLTYAANWDEVFRVPFWDAVDVVGVDAYFPLTLRDGADPAAFERAWRLWSTLLAAHARLVRRRVLLTEIGYRAVSGGARAPGDWRATSARAAPEVQEAAFAAARRALEGAPWLAGLYPWGWGDPSPTGYSPTASGASEVLASWYRAAAP